MFVDDPGYYQTFGHMRVLGATIQGVPWTAAGPDLERLESMARTRGFALRRLEAMGFGPVGDDTHGLYAWMDVPGVADTRPLAEAAAERDILLAPGAMFSPEMTPSTKMRFNVAFSQSDDLFRELEALLNREIRKR